MWDFSEHLLLLKLFHSSFFLLNSFNAAVLLLKVHNRDTRKRCEICSKLATKILEWTLFKCFYCWLSTYFTPFSSVSIVQFKQVNVSHIIVTSCHILFTLLIWFVQRKWRRTIDIIFVNCCLFHKFWSKVPQRYPKNCHT